MAKNDFGAVVLKVGGEAISRDARGWFEIGQWDYTWQSGAYRFRGRIRGHQDWSPLMLKRELREWFRVQVRETVS